MFFQDYAEIFAELRPSFSHATPSLGSAESDFWDSVFSILKLAAVQGIIRTTEWFFGGCLCKIPNFSSLLYKILGWFPL